MFREGFYGISSSVCFVNKTLFFVFDDFFVKLSRLVKSKYFGKILQGNNLKFLNGANGRSKVSQSISKNDSVWQKYL